MHNLILKMNDREWQSLFDATPGGLSMEIFAKEAIFEKVASQQSAEQAGGTSSLTACSHHGYVGCPYCREHPANN